MTLCHRTATRPAVLVTLIAAMLLGPSWACSQVGPVPAVKPLTAADPSVQWRIMPIKSQKQFEAGEIGGEGLQHLHSLARSVSHPDIIILAHDCAQFWRSRDNGRTWRKCLGRNLPLNAAQSVEIDPVNPEIVLAVMESASNYLIKRFEGLYRSTDGGESWQRVLAVESSQQRFYQHCLAWDATSRNATAAQRWYAGLPGGALYRSEDAGLTWAQVADLQGHAPLYAVQTHPSDGRTVYVASTRGLFVSTDRGADLKPLGNLPGGEVTAVAVHPKEPNHLYAVLRGKGLYESRDAGQTFALLKEHAALWFFQNPGHPETMYLLGGDERNPGSLVSRDGGRTWTAAKVTDREGLSGPWSNYLGGVFSGVVPDPRDAGAAVAYSRAHLLRTADGGLTWTDSSTLFTGYAWGFGPGGIAFDRFDPQRYMMMCFDAGPVVTENGGQWFERRGVPWRWYDRGLIAWTGAYRGEYQPVRGSQVALATIGYYHENKVIRTADGGKSWQIVLDRPGHYYWLDFDPRDANVVRTQFHRSTDAGATWQEIPELARRKAELVGQCPARPDTLYALTAGRDEILRSDDGGATWRSYAKPGWKFNGLSSLPSFAVDPVDPDKVYTLGRDRDAACYDGKAWRSLGLLKMAGGVDQLNYAGEFVYDPRRPEIRYATMCGAGLPYVFRSLDGGLTWHDITANLPRCGRGGLMVHPHTGDLMHGSVYGTWVYPPPYDSPTSTYPKLTAHPEH